MAQPPPGAACACGVEGESGTAAGALPGLGLRLSSCHVGEPYGVDAEPSSPVSPVKLKTDTFEAAIALKRRDSEEAEALGDAAWRAAHGLSPPAPAGSPPATRVPLPPPFFSGPEIGRNPVSDYHRSAAGMPHADRTPLDAPGKPRVPAPPDAGLGARGFRGHRVSKEAAQAKSPLEVKVAAIEAASASSEVRGVAERALSARRVPAPFHPSAPFFAGVREADVDEGPARLVEVDQEGRGGQHGRAAAEEEPRRPAVAYFRSPRRGYDMYGR